MRNILIIIVFTISSFFVNGCDLEKKQPNILWIVADDLGPELGCYGNKLIKTPNIDKLATQSIRYTNCHTVSAVCSASRSSLITGMYPVSIDCHQHRTREINKKYLPEGIKPVTEYFKEKGYFVFNGQAEKKGKDGKTDYNFKLDQSLYQGNDWSQRSKNQPFFGQIQIHYPHRPFIHDKVNPINEKDIKLPPYLPDHEIARKDWALYLETIQLVDQYVGEILDRLEKENLLENTYIFFIGDQGRPMVREKQFLYEAGTRTALLIKYPNQKYAGSVKDELVSNMDLAATSLHLANIEIPKYMHSKNILGVHEKRTELFTMRDRRDETVDRIRAIRTDEYRYIKNFHPEKPYTQYNAYKRNFYPTLILLEYLKEEGKLNADQLKFLADSKPEEELYDIKNDPFELNNLANQKDYIKIKEKLKLKMDHFLKEIDVANYPENQEEVEFWKKRMQKTDSVWIANKKLKLNFNNKDLLLWWTNKLNQVK